MHISPTCIAHPQAAELVQPGDGSFYDPARYAQTTAMLSASLADLRRSVGVGPVFSPMPSTYRRTVGNHPREIQPVGMAQFSQQYPVQLLPYTSLLPVTGTTPTTHARAASHFPWQHFPRQAGLQDEQNARQYASLIQAFASRRRLARRWWRKQGLDNFP
jgi:hypothetical protein